METEDTSIITPEDMQYFDIKNVEKQKSDIGSLNTKKSVLLYTIALLLFFIGTLIAPPSVSTGEYQVQINYFESQENFTIQIVDEMAEISVVENETSFGKIIYQNEYEHKPGSIISIQLIPLPIIQEQIDSKNLEAMISNKHVSYTFYGQVQDDNSIIYEFRILSDTRIALGLMFLVSFLWLTELIPLAASSLIIPVVLVITNVQSATVALQPFSEPIIFLFLAGFLMAEAMGRTGLDKFISYRIFAIIPPNDKVLLFSLMTLAAIFSMFMSNTAAVALLIPLALQLLKSVDVGDLNYRKTVVLGIAYAATVGGIGSIIGTPPNIIAVQLLKEFDPTFEISFVEWFLFGLPVVFLILPVIFFYLWYRFKPQIDREKIKNAQIQTRIIIREELQLTKEQLVVSFIFIITLLLWLTTSFHGISSSIIALQAAVALFVVGQLKESDFNVINWNALLTFGGGLVLGGMIIQTGLANYIGSRAIYLAGLPLIVTLFLISLVGLVLTAFASNTASAVIMIPIVMPLGYILGISPVVLAVLVAIAASIDFAIVIGTPPTMMAYSTGLYEVKEIFRIGIVIDFIGLLIISIISTFLFGYIANII